MKNRENLAVRRRPVTIAVCYNYRLDCFKIVITLGTGITQSGGVTGSDNG